MSGRSRRGPCRRVRRAVRHAGGCGPPVHFGILLIGDTIHNATLAGTVRRDAGPIEMGGAYLIDPGPRSSSRMRVQCRDLKTSMAVSGLSVRMARAARPVGLTSSG